MLAIFIVVLVAMTALAVDISRVYNESTQMQKAADEAALGGVIAGSADVPYSTAAAQAQTTAADLVQRNLVVPGGATIAVSSTLTTGTRTRLRVVVTMTGFPLVFAPVIGLRATNITREGTAEYIAPADVGNPTNTFGFPSAAITTTIPVTTNVAPSFSALPQGASLSVNGPQEEVENGDPYSPLNILADATTLANTVPISNPWRWQQPQGFDGYDYQIKIPPGGAGRTTYIQVYDAETCAAGSNGTGQGPFGDLLSTAGYGLPYAGGALTYNPANGPYPTYYRLYAEDLFGDKQPLSAGVIQARGPASGLPPDTALAANEGISPTVSGLPQCDPSTTAKWYTLAELDAGQPGTYIVNVTTCLDPLHPTVTTETSDGATAPNCQGTEVNNFALRAVTVAAPSPPASACTTGTDPDCQAFDPALVDDTNQPTVGSEGRASVTVRSNTGSNSTALLYLAHVPQSNAGRWMRIRIYDPGDLQGGSSIQIVQPDGHYAPFLWNTETLASGGTPITATVFTTTVQNNGSTSLVTSYPLSGLQPPIPTPTSGPTYTPAPTWTPTPPPPTATPCGGGPCPPTATPINTNTPIPSTPIVIPTRTPPPTVPPSS